MLTYPTAHRVAVIMIKEERFRYLIPHRSTALMAPSVGRSLRELPTYSRPPETLQSHSPTPGEEKHARTFTQTCDSKPHLLATFVHKLLLYCALHVQLHNTDAIRHLPRAPDAMGNLNLCCEIHLRLEDDACIGHR